MKMKSYQADTMQEALALVKDEMGPDAVIVGFDTTLTFDRLDDQYYGPAADAALRGGDTVSMR